MDDRDEQLTEIDHALASALDVDPSPDFAARVRRRIATEGPPRGFWTDWRFAMPIAAAAAVILVAGIVMRTTSAPQLLTARPLVVGAIQPAAADPARRVAVASKPENVRIAPTQIASAPRSVGEPEVLVPREQIELYRRLIADAQKAPHAVVIESPDAGVVPASSEIAIDPIKIEPLVPPIGGEGDRQ